MKNKCIKNNPKYLHKDEEYTACSFCKNKCEMNIKCVMCKTDKLVFYKSRRYDAFLCPTCYQNEERKREAKNHA